jgi:hypothetical protein
MWKIFPPGETAAGKVAELAVRGLIGIDEVVVGGIVNPNYGDLRLKQDKKK